MGWRSWSKRRGFGSIWTCTWVEGGSPPASGEAGAGAGSNAGTAGGVQVIPPRRTVAAGSSSSTGGLTDNIHAITVHFYINHRVHRIYLYQQDLHPNVGSFSVIEARNGSAMPLWSTGTGTCS
jgi:hypothetical protein